MNHVQRQAARQVVGKLNTSLWPGPSEYPLVAALGTGACLVSFIAYHHLSSNNEVYIRKSTRELGLIEEGTEECKRLNHMSKVHNDHALKRWVAGYNPWVFSRSLSRKETDIDPAKDRWRTYEERNGKL